ncbi:MAG: thermonuclease family protein [Prosthecobacter sp.]
MKRPKSSFPWMWMLVAVVVVALEILHEQQPKPAPVQQTPGEYITLRSLHLVEDKGNDGDSFLISHEGGRQVLRLYFVDCPEKRSYKLVEARLRDQAAYFGISVAAALRVGQQAKEFTEGLLTERRFTVHTRMERVYDSGRIYAFVFFDDGETLSEKLVKAGLCRIYTRGTDLPDGRTEFEFQQHLRRLETVAREQQLGAWGEVRRRN